MEWIFDLNDFEIEEPIGFDEIELSIVRDDKLHGIGFEASTNSLKFHGTATGYLQEQYDTYGVTANVIFTAKSRCDVNQEFEEIISGRLNFGKFKGTCGSECLVSIPWEADSCDLVFKSRYDQKVDIDKSVAFDNQTAMAPYLGLGINLEIKAKDLLASVDGSVAAEGDIVEFTKPIPIGGYTVLVRPTYLIEKYNNIKTGQLTPNSNWQSSVVIDGIGEPPITPQLLYEDIPTCFPGAFSYDIRMKGEYTIMNLSGPSNLRKATFKILTWDAEGNIFTDAILIAESVLYSGTQATPLTKTFDATLTGSIVLPDGVGLYAYIEYLVEGNNVNVGYRVEFDSETYFRLNANKSCPTTNSKVYLIHETLSRAVEAVTNGCMRVKSEYYGRTDSQPFSFSSDGCGSLRSVTSGLYIRKAKDPTFFISPQELIEGLNPIDNIGIGVEDDQEILGNKILRVEDVKFFYEDREILSLSAIPKADMEVEENKHYSKINVGYETWQPEGINGLDEINSSREYRTNVSTISATLDIKSKLIGGSYLLETTRQQSFADSGGADTGKDDETFIICLKRYGPSLIVEQGNIINPENIYSPETTFNFRISPLRNLMRWYKSILPALPNMASIAQLLFSAGTANITASGEMESDDCKQENGSVSESQDLYVTQYLNSDDYLPIWKNELKTFEYPLSVGQYKMLKSAPYGYINYQCGNGIYIKGWVKEIKYKPVSGVATFILRKKYAQ